jgi:methylenetetrahydrofolate--tRNA-(uracil-5-)-methyltransferase
LLGGINLARMLSGADAVVPPAETMLGALVRYVHGADPGQFQPMNANFGLLPPLEGKKVRDKQQRAQLLADRALDAMRGFVATLAPVAV